MDHKAILELSEADARARLHRLDRYFDGGQGSFFYDSINAVHAIDLFGSIDEVEDESEQEFDRAFAESVTQLLVFAFQVAPPSVVKRWGESHGEGLGEKALVLAEMLRTDFTSGRAEWDRRRDAPGKIFGDITLALVLSPSVNGATIQIHGDSFEPTGTRLGPQGSTRSHFYARLTHLELKRVVAKLSNLDHLITEAEASIDA